MYSHLAKSEHTQLHKSQKKKQHESFQIDAINWFVNYKKANEQIRGWRHGKMQQYRKNGLQIA